MKKITPQSLLFTIAPDIPPETLLIQASETLSSLNAMTTYLPSNSTVPTVTSFWPASS